MSRRQVVKVEPVGRTLAFYHLMGSPMRLEAEVRQEQTVPWKHPRNSFLP